MPILVSFLESTNSSAAKVDRFPDTCPECKVRMTPRFIAATTRAAYSRQICFQCTNEVCRALFVGTYAANGVASFRLLGEESSEP